MRSSALTTSLIAYFTFGSSAVHLADLLRFTLTSSCLPYATPGLIAHSEVPAATRVPDLPVLDNLEIRQVPPVAPVAPINPAVQNANPPLNPAIPAAPANPAIPNAANPILPAAAVALSPTTTITAPPVPPAAVPTSDPNISITVQWVETWIGGTSQTWVPKTITMRFGVIIHSGAQPGHGQIGLGTIVGEVGRTKTVVVGAAQTGRPEWGVALAAVIGAGIAGVL